MIGVEETEKTSKKSLASQEYDDISSRYERLHSKYLIAVYENCKYGGVRGRLLK